MRLFFISFFLITVCTPTLILGQSIEQKFKAYHNTHHIEKIYINHDKPYYAPGETIWCKVYLLDGKTHLPFDAEPVIYIDWIDPNGEIKQTYTIKIVEGTAQMEISSTLKDTPGKIHPSGLFSISKEF